MKMYNLFSPMTVLRLVSYWPPMLFSGISVRDFDLDEGYIKVRLRSSFWNRNYFGTHYGGSICSLCDPFYSFILLHQLGREFIVWDKASKVTFVSATAEPVYATFSINKEDLDQVREDALNNHKVEPIFETTVVDEGGNIIAKVERTLYVKRKLRE
ncbi:MAG: acyl-coenzyme A thioesterase PaaI-like protein [Chlamydiales bacterium]|jgi:acyl-coenzyme A thioesterase PaaI-like protein